MYVNSTSTILSDQHSDPDFLWCRQVFGTIEIAGRPAGTIHQSKNYHTSKHIPNVTISEHLGLFLQCFGLVPAGLSVMPMVHRHHRKLESESQSDLHQAKAKKIKEQTKISKIKPTKIKENIRFLFRSV